LDIRDVVFIVLSKVLWFKEEISLQEMALEGNLFMA
jgi:hypothetical protein